MRIYAQTIISDSVGLRLMRVEDGVSRAMKERENEEGEEPSRG